VSSASATSRSPSDLDKRLEEARASGLVELDLARADPARSGLGWEPADLEPLLALGTPAGPPSPLDLTTARDAVASYLAGHTVSMPPDHVFFAPSREVALQLAVDATCGDDGEVLVPSPALHDARLAPPHRAPHAYALVFGGAWALDRRSLVRALSSHPKAIAAGNPADPTGAILVHEDLEFLEKLCAERDIALVGDEGTLDTVSNEGVSVARATRCLSVHVSGLAGVCGLPGAGAEWVAVAGPPALVERATSRLRSLVRSAPPPSAAGIRALPALLARREKYLDALRARLAQNRAALATASLREAPWTLQWGRGGLWAVLQINDFIDSSQLCLDLLADRVAVRPGPPEGLPGAGFLVVSLVADPRAFATGLARLEARLRQPV